MNITIVGIGYVGLSNAILLSQKNSVTLLDIDKHKVDLINTKKSPIQEELVASYLKEKSLDLIATTDKEEALKGKDFIVVATPTNFDPKINKFDTSIVDSVIADARSLNPNATIIIKSTVPLGYTDKISNTHETEKIIFSPEFLREGQSLEDNLYPTRIILGQTSKKAQEFASLLKEGSLKQDVQILYTSNTEAESIKLFSNTYLAMRVAFFNELDSYALENDLETKNIIDGISTDPRIGNFYNNPSFGYGGYCLPKDTKQLLSNFKNIPQNIIKAVVDSNETRINYLAQKIISLKPKTVGVYRLLMKAGSDNWRESSLLYLIDILIESNIDIIVYEPFMSNNDMNCQFNFVDSIECLNDEAELIITNRLDKDISKYQSKVFTRDLYGNN